MMRIIFLDIDGVLNTDRYIRIQRNHNNGQIAFDPEAMRNLRLLIGVTNAFLVISSTWRIHYDIKESLWGDLVRNLKNYSIDNRIIGITPVTEKNSRTKERWQEIESWLLHNQDKGIDSFVIIDDEWDMGIFKDRFVRCQGYIGLTDELRKKAEKILMNSITEQ